MNKFINSQLQNNLKLLASKDLCDAYAMPKDIYTSKEVLELEEEYIFKNEWLCAGTINEIPNKGDYITYEICKQPILILRNNKDEIKAFSNICLHRMMPLVADKGNRKLITCPYHAWTYNLDGELKVAKYMDKTNCFKKDHLKLPEIKCEVFMGWIYVTLNNTIEPINKKLSKLYEIASPYNMDKYINIISEDHQWNTNWKLLTENFMEGYHLPVAHPKTVGPFINLMNTEFDKKGDNESFTYQFFTKDSDAPVGTAHKDNKSLTGKLRYTSILPTIFPSHMYALAPDHYWYLSLQPDGVDKVKIRFGAAIAPEVLNSQKNPLEFIKKTKQFLYDVQEEDRYVVEGMFKGANSYLSDTGPLSWLERENHEFTKYIARKLAYLD